MKKILILCLVASTAISCLSSGSFSQAYTAEMTFEYSDAAYKDFKDSVYVLSEGEGFAYGQYPIILTQKHLNGKFQGGFLLSCLKGKADGQLEDGIMENDAYRVHAAGGVKGSRTYTVFYANPVASMMCPHDIDFMYKDNGSFTPQFCYVNNTSLVARRIQENFADGDKLTLKAIGHRHDGTTAETSIVLAEYTEAKDSVICNWTQFNLASLGAVDYIDCEINSTNASVPGYFCMDNLVGGVQIEY
jgi:hypothetical protein